MPELPEIETISNGLNRLLPGKVIRDISWDWARSFPNSPEELASVLHRAIKGVRRRGKAILISLEGEHTLLIHLKMTGQLVYGAPEADCAFPDKTTRVILSFTDGSALYFNDLRKFGRIWIMTAQSLEENAFLNTMGPEPLSREFSAKLFQERMSRRSNTFVKAALLDQTVVAGIGNIYCDEALFLAGIMPDRRVGSLSSEEYTRLHRAIRRVLKTAVEMGGSTRRNYLNATGQRGHYLEQAFVYGRTGEPCRKCGQPIQKTRVAGRGSHFCKYCQK